MPIMVEREKWILYKHTSSYELIKAVALDVKNQCSSIINDSERYRMQDRLNALELYSARNPNHKPLDSINHRINTLEFFMFGYENNDIGEKRFIFSPLGNLFLENINQPENLKFIFLTMLFSIQFEHPANGTPAIFQLYPFRLVFKLLRDQRLEYRLSFPEFSYILPFIRTVNANSYETIVSKILDFRALKKSEVIRKFKADEHTFVNCVYEWQYYIVRILHDAGIVEEHKGENIVKLFHPSKTNSSSNPTGRFLRDGYITLKRDLVEYTEKLLEKYSPFDIPVNLSDPERMRMDAVKEVYSFYPEELLHQIGRDDQLQIQLLQLPQLIEEYSLNPENETSDLFENVLAEGFNLFVNVEAKKLGGPGRTDIECLYFTRRKKFAVEAKSTANKLSGINAGRLREHREAIGGEYTIVITPRYVPAAKRDIRGNPIVIILASTFAEYLYNHVQHDQSEIDYADFDDIIVQNLGSDISKQISIKTMEKFSASA